MAFNTILTSRKNKVLTIIINREKSLNSLNLESILEIKSLLKKAESDKTVRCIIITGAGNKSFVSGADINEFVKLKPSEGATFARNGHEFLNYIENFPKPIIAAINGYAIGGGCELAMACHLRIASQNAIFSLPEIKLGIMPGYGGTQRILQYLGKTRALEFMLLGIQINANEAFKIGLINEVEKIENLLLKAQQIGETISKLPAASLSGILKSVNAYYEHHENGFEKEIEMFKNCIKTKDFKEGIQAFIQKRKPKFQ